MKRTLFNWTNAFLGVLFRLIKKVSWKHWNASFFVDCFSPEREWKITSVCFVWHNMAVVFGIGEVDGEDDQNNHGCKYCDIPPTLSGMAVYQHTVRAQFEEEEKNVSSCWPITFTENQTIPHINVHVRKCVRLHVCAYNTFLYVCMHVFFSSGWISLWKMGRDYEERCLCIQTWFVFLVQFCI